MSVERRVVSLIRMLDDMPDWAHMKAVELSRALDEQPLSLETLAVAFVLQTVRLERKLLALESKAVEQEQWNLWFDWNIEYFGELFPPDPGVWEADEEEDEED